MNFLSNYILFITKIFTIMSIIIICVISILYLTNKNKIKFNEKIEVIKINDRYQNVKALLNAKTIDKKKLKLIKKYEKQQLLKANNNSKIRIFVLDFIGDIHASSVKSLREEINAILSTATTQDQILIKIESSGGTFHEYGFAAAQLNRIKEKGIKLIVSIDKIAASGGYLMACVANHIIASPFAIIGSIGVIAQLPNFNRFLRKHDIDFEQITAGKYKRTLSMFGKNTIEGKHKLQQEIEEAHNLFKEFIISHRSVIDIDSISTGETWFGIKAKEKGLIDEIKTSDDYIISCFTNADIYEIKYITKKNITERFIVSLTNSLYTMSRKLIN